MKIEVEKNAIENLLRSYCQFLVEEGQHTNLRDGERGAIASISNVSLGDVTPDFILNQCGYCA